jgi:voltage-gated potassium channel
MITKHLEKLASHLWAEGRGPYYLLIILFLTIFVAPPLVIAQILPQVFIHIAMALVLLTGVFTVPCPTALRLIALLIAFVAVVGRFVDVVMSGQIPAATEIVLSVVALTLFAVLIIRQFLAKDRAIKHRIAAAIAVYLVLGLLWARLYELVILFNPGAFQIAHDDGIATLFYFSFVTLMTIGYGDVVPVSLIARNLAILEGLTGQLYLVILISSLVAERSTKSYDS